MNQGDLTQHLKTTSKDELARDLAELTSQSKVS